MLIILTALPILTWAGPAITVWRARQCPAAPGRGSVPLLCLWLGGGVCN